MASCSTCSNSKFELRREIVVSVGSPVHQHAQLEIEEGEAGEGRGMGGFIINNMWKGGEAGGRGGNA